MGETIKVIGHPIFDDDGHRIDRGPSFEISDCVVSPLGESRIDQADVDGTSTKLQILAPPGTDIDEGSEVLIRGVVYTVMQIPFDWSIGRRPVVTHHRPRVRIVVEREEG